jgi:hypothetical protein
MSDRQLAAFAEENADDLSPEARAETTKALHRRLQATHDTSPGSYLRKASQDGGVVIGASEAPPDVPGSVLGQAIEKSLATRTTPGRWPIDIICDSRAIPKRRLQMTQARAKIRLPG